MTGTANLAAKDRGQKLLGVAAPMESHLGAVIVALSQGAELGVVYREEADFRGRNYGRKNNKAQKDRNIHRASGLGTRDAYGCPGKGHLNATSGDRTGEPHGGKATINVEKAGGR